jgi:methylase of polypeptide subunit release factors
MQTQKKIHGIKEVQDTTREKQTDAALIALGRYLKQSGYQFTTITPVSHQNVLDRKQEANLNQPLRELLGWNKKVSRHAFSDEIFSLLLSADAIEEEGGWVRSRVRFSTLGSFLFLHSKFPTIDSNSVFFGPDSYRFVKFLKDKACTKNVRSIVDLGCGSGVGGILLQSLLQTKYPDQEANDFKAYYTDINHTALRYAEINLKINEMSSGQVIESNLFKNVPKGAELIVANPPFIMDLSGRAYRDGGKTYGTDLAVEIVRTSLQYLEENQGGMLALYTGTCHVEGKDVFWEQVAPLFAKSRHEITVDYEEIDPDIFGEELREPAYQRAERIAAVGLIASLNK